MHAIEPARLKPGASIPRRRSRARRDPAASAPARPLIRGRALIFWDPKSPPGTKKLDAIDTDQITPAADCVSESLETLDERWKAGSFRYLMPDFRARVHRGETFVIAGDRFAIGSSREMSPAGLKGVAEEAGLELVDRLRPQHGRHLPPQQLQPRAARRPEPRGGRRRAGRRRVQLRSGRRASCATRRRARPTPRCRSRRRKRRSAAAAASSPSAAASFRRRCAPRPSIDWPDAARRAPDDDDRADRLGAPRRQGSDAASSCSPGTTLRVYADLLPASDGTAPFAIHTFNQITGGDTIYPAAGGDRQRSLRLHRRRRRRQADRHRPRVRARARHRASRTTRRPATASSTSTFPSRGW